MKIILCTNVYYHNHNNPLFVKYTNAIKKLYCDINNIEFYYRQKEYYPGFHPVWFKLPMIKQCFDLCDSSDDWIIWMDADATTPNINIDIRPYLQNEQKKIIILKDANNFNAGVFAVPNTARAKQFIDYIDSQRTNQRYRDVGWRQQQVMIDCFNNDYKDFYKIPPCELGFNCYTQENNNLPPKFQKNKSFCLHIPNTNDTQRSERFKKYYLELLSLICKNFKIIVPQNELSNFNYDFYITCQNKNQNDIYYEQGYFNKIEELLNIDLSQLNDIEFIGYCNLNKQIEAVEFNLNKTDIVLGPIYNVKNILNQFIVDDLYHRSDIHDYDLYIKEFIKIFDKEEMEILLSSSTIHFGGQFITSKQIFQDYIKFLKQKLNLFTNSDLVKKIIKNKNELLMSFSQRILQLYCQKNKLKIMEQ